MDLAVEIVGVLLKAGAGQVSDLDDTILRI